MSSQLRRTLIFAAVSLPIVLTVVLAGQYWLDARRYKFLSAETSVLHSSIFERFEAQLGHYVSIVQLVSTIWSSGQSQHFAETAEQIIAETPEVQGLSELSLDGVITQAWPYLSNRGAVGRVTQNLASLNEARASKKNLWFSNPFKLYQTEEMGFGVYHLIKDAKGQPRGWIALVVSSDALFRELKKTDSGKSYDLRAIESRTGLSYISDKAELPSKIEPGLVKTNRIEIHGREIEIQLWLTDELMVPVYLKAPPLLIGLGFWLLLTYVYYLLEGRKMASAQLEDLNQLLRLAIHDTSTSLTTIKGYLEFMKDDPALVPVDRLSRHVGFVVDLLDQIKLVRQYSAKDSWKRERLSLLNFVLEVSDILSERLRGKDIFLKYDPEELSRAQLYLNRGLFGHSVLGNLLGQAITYSPPGSTLQIRYRKENATHVIDIQDQAKGPAGSGRIGKSQQTGKGLESFSVQIVEQVMQLHDGKLEFIPLAEGGRIARLTLPDVHLSSELRP